MKLEKHVLTIDEIIAREQEGELNGGSPINISIFPNYMGINLVSVDRIEWTEREDNSLVDMTVFFIPLTEEELKTEKEENIEYARKEEYDIGLYYKNKPYPVKKRVTLEELNSLAREGHDIVKINKVDEEVPTLVTTLTEEVVEEPEERPITEADYIKDIEVTSLVVKLLVGNYTPENQRYLIDLTEGFRIYYRDEYSRFSTEDKGLHKKHIFRTSHIEENRLIERINKELKKEIDFENQVFVVDFSQKSADKVYFTFKPHTKVIDFVTTREINLLQRNELYEELTRRFD